MLRTSAISADYGIRENDVTTKIKSNVLIMSHKRTAMKIHKTFEIQDITPIQGLTKLFYFDIILFRMNLLNH